MMLFLWIDLPKFLKIGCKSNGAVVRLLGTFHCVALVVRVIARKDCGFYTAAIVGDIILSAANSNGLNVTSYSFLLRFFQYPSYFYI